MQSALIALAGVLLGALLGEYFRRRNRIEIYSQKIFERRLEVYEGLMALVQDAYTTASHVIENNQLSQDERQALISSAIHSIADYTDANTLFVDSYVSAHATAMVMGVEDIPDISDKVERASEIARFRSDYVLAKKMILEESGIQQINEHFKLVSQSKPNSPVIRRIKELERK